MSARSNRKTILTKPSFVVQETSLSCSHQAPGVRCEHRDAALSLSRRPWPKTLLSYSRAPPTPRAGESHPTSQMPMVDAWNYTDQCSGA